MDNITFEGLPQAVCRLIEKLDAIEQILLEQTSQKSANPPEQLLDIQEAAKLLKLTVPTIYSKVSRRELPFMKSGKRLYFSRIEILDFIKQGRQKSNDEINATAESYLK
jgi:excisionase family DNA binding protein